MKNNTTSLGANSLVAALWLNAVNADASDDASSDTSIQLEQITPGDRLSALSADPDGRIYMAHYAGTGFSSKSGLSNTVCTPVAQGGDNQ